MRFWLYGLLSLLTSFPAFASADQLHADYESLQSVPANYTVFGTICEFVARLRLAEIYPEDEYQIEVGIEYKDRGRTVGELDVVVFRRDDQKAVIVSEVKCRKALRDAVRHAHQQLQRFQTTLASSRTVQIIGKDGARHTYLPSQFDAVEDYLAISQEGGIEAGFDMTIGHDLNEVSTLRDMLMACQARGDCPRSALLH